MRSHWTSVQARKKHKMSIEREIEALGWRWPSGAVYTLFPFLERGLQFPPPTARQFRTPRHIIKFMVDAIAPTPTDTICDPASGTCGFLVVANDYIREHHPEALFTETEINELIRSIESLVSAAADG